MKITEEEQRALLMAAKQYEDSAAGYRREYGDRNNPTAIEHEKIATTLRNLEQRLRRGR